MTIDRILGEDPEGKTPEEFRGDMGERGGGAPGGGGRRASNMFADIAKVGHSLKKTAPIVKKVDPKMNLLNSFKKEAGGGLKHVEIGEERGGVQGLGRQEPRHLPGARCANVQVGSAKCCSRKVDVERSQLLIVPLAKPFSSILLNLFPPPPPSLLFPLLPLLHLPIPERFQPLYLLISRSSSSLLLQVASEIERVFESVARSCMAGVPNGNGGGGGGNSGGGGGGRGGGGGGEIGDG